MPSIVRNRQENNCFTLFTKREQGLEAVSYVFFPAGSDFYRFIGNQDVVNPNTIFIVPNFMVN